MPNDKFRGRRSLRLATEPAAPGFRIAPLAPLASPLGDQGFVESPSSATSGRAGPAGRRAGFGDSPAAIR